MPARLKPRIFRVVDCGKLCTLNEGNLPPGAFKLVHGWFEAGFNDMLISAKAQELNFKLSKSAVARHRSKHLYPESPKVDLIPMAPSESKMSDLAVLEKIISRGASLVNLDSSRISPEMTIRAIELKFKLTQGSAFESFLAALGETMGEVSVAEVGPDVMSEEEASQGAVDAEPAA